MTTFDDFRTVFSVKWEHEQSLGRPVKVGEGEKSEPSSGEQSRGPNVLLCPRATRLGVRDQSMPSSLLEWDKIMSYHLENL